MKSLSKILTITTLLITSSSSLAQSDIIDACLVEKAYSVQELHPGNAGYIIFESEINTKEADWILLAQNYHRLASEFKKRGIDLVVIPIPQRTIIDPSILNIDDQKQKDFLNIQKNGLFDKIISQFSLNDGKVINILPDLRNEILLKGRDEISFKNEFHWKQAGALVTAKKIADFMKNNNFNTANTQYEVVKTNLLPFQPVLPIQKLYQVCSAIPNLSYQGYSVIKSNEPFYYDFYELEQDGQKSWRWAKGPVSSIFIKLDEPINKQMALSFENPLDRQGLKILVNGKSVYLQTSLKPGDYKDVMINLNLSKGINKIDFITDKWNKKDNLSTFANNDQRNLSINLTSMKIDGISSSESIGLLDDYIPEIHLVGTSYSKYMNLSELIKGVSGNDILDFSRQSGGIYGSMSEYVDQLNFDNKPKMILWEIPLMWPSANATQEIDKIISKFRF